MLAAAPLRPDRAIREHVDTVRSPSPSMPPISCWMMCVETAALVTTATSIML